MSMHSSEFPVDTPQGDDLDSDAVPQMTDDERQRREYLEAIADNRDEIDQLYARGTRITGEVPVIVLESETETPETRVVIDPDREQLEEYVPPTDEQRALAKERLAGVRATLGRVERRVGVRAVSAPLLIEAQGGVEEVPEADETERRRAANASAKQISIETGISHRVVPDGRGDFIVEPAFKKRK